MHERRKAMDSMALSADATQSSTDAQERSVPNTSADDASAGHAEQLFAAVDKNGDGVIDREEFLQAFKLLNRSGAGCLCGGSDLVPCILTRALALWSLQHVVLCCLLLQMILPHKHHHIGELLPASVHPVLI